MDGKRLAHISFVAKFTYSENQRCRFVKISELFAPSCMRQLEILSELETNFSLNFYIM